MTLKLKVGIPYASNYSDISPGGIQVFIKLIGEFTPTHFEVTYFGVGESPNFLRLGDNWVEVMSRNEANNSRNLQLKFAWKLRKYKNILGEMNVLLHHRAESRFFIGGKSHVFVNHSPSWGGIKTRGLVKGLLLYFFELYTASRCTMIISVNVKKLSLLTKMLCNRIYSTRVPLESSFVANELPPQNRRLISTNRLEKGKGLEKLIKVSRNVGLPVIFFGGGSYANKIEILCKKAQVEFELRGYVDPKTLSAEYKLGGFFLNLSKSEGYPLSCVEALASGLPVMGLSSTPGLNQLASYGLHLFDNLEELEAAVLSGTPGRISKELVKDHSPSSVAKLFWNKFLSNEIA